MQVSDRIDLLLSQARSWQQCLSLIEQDFVDSGKKINYAFIARKSGFSSRSYIRMLFQGKRNPTLQSLDNLLSALKISNNAKKFILLLWQSSKLIEGSQKSNQLLKQIETLRLKLQNNTYKKIKDENFLNVDCPIVFAALGAVQQGITIVEIKKKTGLSDSRIQLAVDALVENASAVHQNGLIYPTVPQLVIHDSLKSGFFKNYYFDLLKKAEVKATNEFYNKKNLFSSFAVSIDSSKQQEYSDRLYKLLIDFLNEIESVDGDKILKLNASMFD